MLAELLHAPPPVVLITPTANVVERRGMYRAYVAGDRAIHLVEAVGFSEADDFLGMIRRVAEGGEIK